MLITEAKKSRFFYGFVVVAAACVIMMLMFGSMYSFGVFFKPLLAEFGWTRAMTSGAFSLSFFLQGIMGMVVGRFNDRFGPRLVASFCGVFLGGGFLLMSLIREIWQFYLVYGVVIAVGVSAGIAMLSIPPRWFLERRGLMTGVVISGVGLGTLIMPPLTNWLILTFNWRTSYIVLGIGVLVLMEGAAQFLKRDPAQMGLEPYGNGGVRGQALKGGGGDSSFAEALGRWQFWMLGVLFFFHTFAVQTIMVHVVLYAQGKGLSPAEAAGIIATIGAATIAGRVFLGMLLDRIGSRSILLVSFLIKTAALVLLLFVRTRWLFYVFAAIFGIGYGGAAVANAPMVADLFGLSALSLILAGVSLIGTLGAAFGPVVAGRIFDITESYLPAFLISIGLSVAGFFLAILLRPTSKGGKR